MQGDLFSAIAAICHPASSPGSIFDAQVEAARLMCIPDPPSSLVLSSELSDAEADAIIDVLLD